MVSNTQIIFTKIPITFPVVGEHMVIKKSQIDLDTDIPQGAILTKSLVLSVDPYMRTRMRNPEIPSYLPAFELNETMPGFTIAQVLKSNNAKFVIGDIVYGMGDFAEYVITPEPLTAYLEVRNEIKSSGIPITNYAGVLGMPGMTAYVGLLKYGKPVKGETLYVSAASGAVGQLVGQIGIKLGLRVVGSAGSDEKVAYLKEVGFDAAFNYKTVDVQKALGEHCPNGIDIYFENVGGKMLEAVIDHANKFARIVCCGMISQYNRPNHEPIHNILEIVVKSLEMHGFIVTDNVEMDEPFKRDVTKWLKAGDIKYREDIVKGIENTPEALIGILCGNNFGKKVIHIADFK